MAVALGIDIGGSGMKGAPVDLETGSLVSDRLRIATPRPATAAAVAAEVRTLVRHFAWSGPIGATFPAVIQHGVARTAANVDPSWIGTDVAATLSKAAGGPVKVMNDADAAGVAEVRFGAARETPGTVLMLTFGTGIGSALFADGRLVPNTEFGHLELDGTEAERAASDSARERDGLSWTKWARRVQRYLRHLELLLSPDLFVLGGGASKQADRWFPSLDLATTVRIAGLRNNAGIVGAALAARSPAEPSETAAASG
jgi:polyphosphate glucokinase